VADDRTAAIVAATVELAHRLGLRLVAEGVEDDPTLQALRALGCDESQGYLHCRPQPVPVLEEWLGARRATVPLPRRTAQDRWGGASRGDLPCGVPDGIPSGVRGGVPGRVPDEAHPVTRG
jgi:predicted signal transduction protein with EAL and GGDEF domain